MSQSAGRRSSGRGAAKEAGAPDVFDEYKLRYEAYSRLQAAAVAFGDACKLPIPEIVAIGGQSDGKSSLLEALLGFRFNVREVEMGTRRPLVVQMVHDPTALEPRCRLQDEGAETYGPPIVPETAVADAIASRTAAHLAALGGGASVSARPIVMRAEYAHAPNLTIIDTPGFIMRASAAGGEAASTPDDILAMVKAQAAPPHRLILFLQQSSVEWASSLWLRVVQEVDPGLRRTVVVASKFDNRLQEFNERHEVDRYLAADGYLPPGVKPFFVALPKERGSSASVGGGGSAEFRRQLGEVDAGVLAALREGVKGGFDEARFGARVGFANLKRFLEDELARRYREAAPATLALLSERCDAVAGELRALEARVAACGDVAAQRRSGMRHAAAVAAAVRAALAGCAEPDPATHGMTTDEERAAAQAPAWPGVAAGAVRPPNADLRLYGGAAFERCLNEFQEAAAAAAFPAASAARERVANVLLAYKGRHAAAGGARAAEDIAREAARARLGPLLDAAAARLAFVLRRAVDIATERAMRGGDGAGGGTDASSSASESSSDGAAHQLAPYVAFHAALRAAHTAFVTRLEARVRGLLRHHLDAATSEFALALLASMPEAAPAPRATPAAMGPPPAVLPAAAAAQAGGDGDAENQAPGGGDVDDAATAAATTAAPARTPFRPSQMTVPETPSPEGLLQAGANGGGKRAPAGPGRHVSDTTPSKGRALKSARTETGALALLHATTTTTLAEGMAAAARGGYADVVAYAERLFGRIRHAVAAQAVTTAKAAFLEPAQDGSLGDAVALELFARPDAEYGALFTSPGVLGALQGKRDALQRRADGLHACKAEFEELAQAL